MKARQCLAGILTAAMLASLAPSALAAEEPPVPDEEPSVLIQTEVAQADTAAEEHPAPAMVYGLGGRDVATEDIARVYDHLFLLAENGGQGPKYIHMGQRSSETEVL